MKGKHSVHHHHAKGGTVHVHHHHRKTGGRTDMKVSGNPDVFKETKGEEHKKGGRVHHRKDGGKVVGKMSGGAVKPRLDRPARAKGGGVGSDTSPLTSAHKTASSAGAPHEQGGN